MVGESPVSITIDPELPVVEGPVDTRTEPEFVFDEEVFKFSDPEPPVTVDPLSTLTDPLVSDPDAPPTKDIDPPAALLTPPLTETEPPLALP